MFFYGCRQEWYLLYINWMPRQGRSQKWQLCSRVGIHNPKKTKGFWNGASFKHSMFHFSFGVCCLFIVTATSDTIDQNCTYIQNPSFPSVYSSQTALTYTINKCSSDACSVRLDFETFAISGPAVTTEATGGTCTDSFVASGTSGITSPVICGMNAGQHSKYFYTSSIISSDVLSFSKNQFLGGSQVINWSWNPEYET